MSQLRNFEISIWTLQDDFITTIESAWVKTKGKTQNASMTLNIDGTQQLTFSVPMYYSMNGQKISNPAWITFSENKVLLNTRKVKVILNKQTDDEEIYEFVIDKVTERHEHDELFCDVECSGLAFYELGKIGYKVSLSEDDFYNDDYSWFSGETDSDGNLLFEEQPVANIQYWLNKFLKPYSDEDFSAAQWYYKIQMNWDLTADFSEFKKDSDKIYENDVYGDTYLLSQEKYRMINLEESNFYNLTQNIAETFGVYCKYIYSYDENYHIIGRIIVFYNNFLNEEKLSINYRGNTQSISRELDTSDLITKMYVKSVDNSGETISIIDVDENELGEDYLLNFDYLHSIGSIDDDDYNEIEPYKAKLKTLNIQLKSVSEEIINIESKLPEVRARASLAEDSIQLDKEKINSSNKLLTNLTNGTNVLQVTSKNPDTAVLLPESNINTGTNADYYYIKITKLGVDLSTLKIYKSISLSGGTYNFSSADEIKTGIPIYDEAGNLIKITNIYWSQQDEESRRSKIVYLTYDYSPKLYYENVVRAWQNKLNKDKQEFDDANAELTNLESQLESATNRQKELINQKNELNSSFERMMGPAIREGYWQPDNYSEYAETFVSNYDIGKESEGTSHYDKFVWDDQLFDGELDISYKEGIDQQLKYYPCIELTKKIGDSISGEQSTIWDKIKNHLNSYSLIFYDTSLSEERNSTTLRTISFGSGARIIFLKRSPKGRNNYGAPSPYLLLPGLKNYLETSINNAKSYSLIGDVEYNSTNGYVITGGDDGHGIQINPSWWIDLSAYDYKPVYPRIRIESALLKTDTNSLIISDNGLYGDAVVLSQYVDYYVNNRVEESQYKSITQEGDSESAGTVRPLATAYYITIKPEVIAKTSELNNHILKIMFQISNYGVAIYRDAKEILKDNSKPKVSYDSTIDIFNKDAIKRPSYFLSKIVKINDYDLLLDDAWGYVSGVTLDLDHPENDSIEIQNYTNKFEDLFTTIVAQTEEMKRTSYIIDTLSNSFASDGTLSANTLQNSLSKVDLNYAFNNGTLNIDEANGIWGISDSGVVAFRGGGIFTATERDKRNNWVWNTGITPEGINADLITTGQLDTNKIRVFAGDRERFQLNGEGLYAYKTFISDFDVFSNFNEYEGITEKINKNDTLDPAQFVRFDENGLFLVAKEGAYVLNKDRTFYTVISEDVLDADDELKRVAITWDGLSLRNLNGEKVFYADPDSGDLMLKGSVFADGFYVIDEDNNTTKLINLFVRDVSTQELYNQLKENRDVGLRVKDYISSMSGMIAGKHLKTMEEGVPETHVGDNFPANYSIGDYFYKNDGKVYICVSKDGATAEDNWELLTELSDDAKASMSVDAINGTIKLFSDKEISMMAVDAQTGDSSVFSITPSGVNIGANKTISLTSGANIDINSGGMFSAIGGEALIATSSNWQNSNNSNYIWMHYDNQVEKEVLEIATDDLRLKSGGNFIVEAGGQVAINAGGSISLLSSNAENPNMSGIKISDVGIDVYSDAYLHIATNDFKITTISDGGQPTDVKFTDYVEGIAEQATSGLISHIEVQYAENQDSQNAPQNGWSTTAPSWKEGWYIWQRTATTNSIGTNYSDPTCISGANGKIGKDGIGISSTNITYGISVNDNIEPINWYDNIPTNIDKGQWLWIKTIFTYSNNDTRTIYTKSYIGSDGENGKSVYIQSVNKVNGKTTVVLNDGVNTSTLEIEDGEDGQNGTPGINGYVHIAWANSADGQIDFSTTISTNKKYIGIYSDGIQDDSTSPDTYSWSLIKGSDGVGIQSTMITYGISTGSNIEPQSWSENVPTAISKKTWLWVKTVTTYTGGLETKTTYTKSYVGDDGQDGKSVYIQSSTKVGKVTTVTLIDSDGNTTPLIINDGEEGQDGTPGVNGYVHIAWANSVDGALDFSTSVSTDKKYIGVYTDSNSIDSITPSDYSWSLIKGEDGIGIDSTSITYGISDSVSTQPSTWDTNVPTALNKGDWLWTKTEIIYTNGDIKTTYMKSYAGLDGTSGDNGFNQATIYLYQRADNKPANISSGNFTYTFSSGILSSYPNGWSRNIPTGNNPCWVISTSVISREASTTFSYDKWTEPIKLVENGAKTITIYLYQRNSQQPTVMPGTITYNFLSKTITSGTMNNWQTAVPADNGQPCWIITAIASSVNETDTIATSEWGTAIKFVESGINQATLYLYQWAQSAPTKPTNSLTYTFSTKTLSGSLGLWSTNIPVNNDNYQSCYITSTVVVSSTDTYTIPSSEWATPVEFVRNGADGTSVNILGSYNSEAELRAAHPTGFNGDAYIINGNLYVWASNDWENVGVIQGPKGDTGDNGTSQYMFIRYATTDLSSTPNSTNFTTTPTSDTLYIGICVTTTNSAPSTANGYTWSKYMGTDGINRATIMLYMRSANTPTTKPATFIYDFSTGIPSTANLNSWEKSIPADDGNPCWVIAATAISSSATDQIASSEWTSPTKMVQSGEDGLGIASVSIQYGISDNASSAPTSWANSSPTTIAEGKWLWVKTVTTYTDSNYDTVYTKTYVGKNGSSVGISSITDIKDANNNTIGKKITFTDSQTMDIMNGEDGENGIIEGDNIYVHVAWTNQIVSPYEGFSTSQSTDKKYLGIYRDANELDSTNPSDYSWTLIKGEDGDDGVSIVSITPLYYCSGINKAPNPPTQKIDYPFDVQGYWTMACPTMDETYKYMYTCSQIEYTQNGSNWFGWSEVVQSKALTDLNERIVQAELSVDPDQIIARVSSSFVERYANIVSCTPYYLVSSSDEIPLHSNDSWSEFYESNSLNNHTPYLFGYYNLLYSDGYVKKTNPEFIWNYIGPESTISPIVQINTYYRVDERNLNDEILDTLEFLPGLPFGDISKYDKYTGDSSTPLRSVYMYLEIIHQNGFKTISPYVGFGTSKNYKYKQIELYYAFGPTKTKTETWQRNNSSLFNSTIEYSDENPYLYIYIKTVRSTGQSSYWYFDIVEQLNKEGCINILNIQNIFHYTKGDSIAAPTTKVTETGTTPNRWYIQMPAYNSDYPDIYTCNQILTSESEYTTSSIIKIDSTVDKNERIKNTEIALTDNSIRMQASKIIWVSDNSRMYEDGTLRISRAIIDGTWSGVYNNYGVKNGLLLGRAQIIGLINGQNSFNILMPFHDTTPEFSIQSYVDSDGNVISGNIEPIIPELPTFNLDNHTVSLPDSLDENTDKVYIITNQDSECGLVLGTESRNILSFSNNGLSVLLNTNNLYISNGTNVFKGKTYDALNPEGKTLHFVNGILVGYD